MGFRYFDGRRFVLLAAVAITLAGCPQSHYVCPTQRAALQPASQPSQAPRHGGPGRVADAKQPFSIVPPEGYRSSGASIHHFMNFLGPAEDGLTVNFNVSLRTGAAVPLDQAAGQALQANKILLRQYVKIEDGFETIDGHKTFFCSGSFVWDGKRCRNLQYFFPGLNNCLYVITFASLEESFSRHRAAFEMAARSARVD